MITVKASYETTDATVNSQIVQMKAAGCDTFLLIAIPKFEALAIRKVAEIEWKPLFITNGIAASVGAAFKPAGLENCKGIVTDNSFKDPTDPELEGRPRLQMVGLVYGQVLSERRQER